MRLLLKFNLIFLLVFLVGLTVSCLVARGLLQKAATDEVADRARLLIEKANAVSTYTADQIRPLLETQMKYTFLPQSVPAYSAAEVLASAGLDVTPVTEEEDVKAVLTKVTLGEVDAGLVYVTDVQAAGDEVRGVEVPEADAASTTYPIAALAGSEHAEQARAFVDLVLSEEGRTALEDAGFGLP